jgi:hypothetical protein
LGIYNSASGLIDQVTCSPKTAKEQRSAGVVSEELG